MPEHTGLDLVRGGQQRALLSIVADDPPVLTRVAGRRNPAGQFLDRLGPADLIELAAFAQDLGDRQVVDLPVAVVELDHGGKHGAVLLSVEVVGTQMLLDQQPVQMPFIEQDRAQHGLLGLEIVRWNGDRLDSAHGSSSLGSWAASARRHSR